MLSVRQKLSLSISWVRRHTIRINKLFQGHIVNNWQNQDWKTDRSTQEPMGFTIMQHCLTYAGFSWNFLLICCHGNQTGLILTNFSSKSQSRRIPRVKVELDVLCQVQWYRCHPHHSLRFICFFPRCSLVKSILLKNKMLTANRKIQEKLRETE